MKSATSARLILFHPHLHKQLPTAASRLWTPLLFFFFTFSTLAFLTLTLINTAIPSLSSAAPSSASALPIPPSVRDALLHYAAAANATSTARMSASELATLSAAIRRCSAGVRARCNLLVFGLTHETLLYRALNSNGRTVFLDESEFLISRMEQQHEGIEAYDVQYTTKVSELRDLLWSAREDSRGDCRPVQNLLFSECRLALNDLPNHIYEIDWDVIVIDGPAGYSPTSPGRMSAIFTAAVLARSKKGTAGGTSSKTHIFVHDFDREVEKVCSEEYLCKENLVETVNRLGHFVVERMGSESSNSGFCSNSSSLPSPLVTTSL
ncbi:protein IRX15-LIKE-like [Punica granatum]|uniref:Protein IRX15-LIKE-like n=1 Tax=Punica granatum TaxID=22663 RepID=A0A6P8D3V4_PUNGR|nr:protein IRX15-LIKE-like [Punica granatum]